MYHNTIFFIIAMASGVFFFTLSMYFLPFIVLSPGKFAGCFMFGSISCIYGIGILKGFKAFFWYLLEKERRWISLMYLITLMANIYYTLIVKTYLIVLVLSV